jgi:LPXTG-motif cell wall-anchored protein
VREHGGDIQIESAENRGTTVRVTLPATGEETSVNPAAASAASSGAGLSSL